MEYEIIKAVRRAREVAVVGLGISNLPLVEFLIACGVRVTGRDRATKDKLSPEALALEERGVPLILGDGYLNDLSEDVIFRSPGIRPDIPEFAAARAGGAMITSEMELFFELCPCATFGITGSDGKTTTTTLTGKMLEEESRLRGDGRRVYVGGNIKAPLLPKVAEMKKDDYAVLELSSFQLMTMQKPPMRSAITNITPNHLNWHTDMEEYEEAKTHVLSDTHNVLNASNDRTSAIAGARGDDVRVFSSSLSREELRSAYPRAATFYLEDGWICSEAPDGNVKRRLRVSDILLPGRHNIENYMTAIALTDGLVSDEAIATVARTFAGVEHRLELVREAGGVRFYNSSIDSTPTRTAAAVSALDRPPIILCGGYDKHVPFDTLAELLLTRVKAVVLTGDTGEKIFKAMKESPAFDDSDVIIIREEDFDTAVYDACTIAEEGDIVLLSPACASFDRFKNFEERGRHFKDLVMAWKGKNQ